MPEPAPEIPQPPQPEPEPDLPQDPTPEPTPVEVPRNDPQPAPEIPQEIPPADIPTEVPLNTPPPEFQPAPRLEMERTSAQAGSELAAPTRVESAKPGFIGRLMGRAQPATVVRRVLDDEMLEQLEEVLIAADMGVDTALRVVANVAEGHYGRKLSVVEIKELLAAEVARIMEPVAKPLPLYPRKPQVVLVVGVNGSGKTTTIGKLASQFKAAGKKVVIAAGDTFRAAAVEQLQVWGERANVPVLTAPEGSDPASLAFDAMAQIYLFRVSVLS